jgi:hypothetical protein
VGVVCFEEWKAADRAEARTGGIEDVAVVDGFLAIDVLQSERKMKYVNT